MDMVIFRNMVDPISTKFYHMFDNLITPAEFQNFGKISADILPGIQTKLYYRLFLHFINVYWNFEFSIQNVLWQLRWWPYRESYKKMKLCYAKTFLDWAWGQAQFWVRLRVWLRMMLRVRLRVRFKFRG